MSNPATLVPFTGANDPRRHNGRKKGSKNLATLIRELENEEFDWSQVPKHGQKLQAHFGGKSPLKVIVLVTMLQGIRGSKDAREWLRKAGYGDQLDVTSKGESIAPKVVSGIEPHVKPQSETVSSDSGDQ